MFRPAHRLFSATFLAALSLLPSAFAQTAATPPVAGQKDNVAEQKDNYVWLEDVNGAKAMDWVKAENERTAKILEADPRFSPFQSESLRILESPDRLAYPDFHEGAIYNTWQDAQHVHGILRRTTLADYLKPTPQWQTILDYDELSATDHEQWVQRGLNCLYPGDGLCMAFLSAGGEDAATAREFDLKSGKFVSGGFTLPKSKGGSAWVDKDTLLIARDWGAGTLTTSGYPFIVKRWKRGEPLDQAKEIFRGAETDGGYGVNPATLNDAQGHQAILISRPLNTFDYEISLVTPTGVKLLDLPKKHNDVGLLDGQLIFEIQENWKPEGSSETIVAGSVISLDLAAVESDPVHLKPTIVFAPSAREFEQEVAVTRNHLLLVTLENVQGRAYEYAHAKTGWTHHKLSVPDNQSVNIVSTNTSDDQFFLSLTGFLTPSSLQLGDASTGTLKTVKTLPAQFDASKEVVEQLQATSKDGTKVPYFLVHRKDMKYDGSNPTLLYAYGGFQVSITPTYSGPLGKLWLEHDGVYALANIRGGGEFGPAWHEAGLKTNRQRIYDDFAAVGQDLVKRKITTSRRLGIEGGSNGGLQVGVQFTQHPEMWHAVDIEVPLLDMIGFEHIAAGASWVGEYGSASVPEERRFLASISPYNQLKPDVDYPEPLIFTTTKDDRVGPVHARKFAARLEEFHKPFLYDEIVEGGHGAGANLKEQARTVAERWIYFTQKLMD